jgi:hypothetical protein
MATVVAVGEDDVLLGRGLGPNRIEGNIRFRQIVWDTYLEYKSSYTSGQSERDAAGGDEFLDAFVKKEVADLVLKRYKEAGRGRFLRRISGEELESRRTGSDPARPGTRPAPLFRRGGSSDYYQEVSDREAVEKIKQSIRFQVKRHRRDRGGRSSPATGPREVSTTLTELKNADGHDSMHPSTQTPRPSKRKSGVLVGTVSSFFFFLTQIINVY